MLVANSLFPRGPKIPFHPSPGTVTLSATCQELLRKSEILTASHDGDVIGPWNPPHSRSPTTLQLGSERSFMTATNEFRRSSVTIQTSRRSLLTSPGLSICRNTPLPERFRPTGRSELI